MQQYKADHPGILTESDHDDDDSGKRSKRNVAATVMAFAPVVIFTAAIMLLTFQSPEASEELSAKFQSILKAFWGNENYPVWVADMKLLRAFAHVFLYIPVSMGIYYATKHFTVSWPKAACRWDSGAEAPPKARSGPVRAMKPPWRTPSRR